VAGKDAIIGVFASLRRPSESLCLLGDGVVKAHRIAMPPLAFSH
jgi:hypothetical protein